MPATTCCRPPLSVCLASGRRSELTIHGIKGEQPAVGDVEIGAAYTQVAVVQPFLDERKRLQIFDRLVWRDNLDETPFRPLLSRVSRAIPRFSLRIPSDQHGSCGSPACIRTTHSAAKPCRKLSARVAECVRCSVSLSGLDRRYKVAAARAAQQRAGKADGIVNRLSLERKGEQRRFQIGFLVAVRRRLTVINGYSAGTLGDFVGTNLAAGSTAMVGPTRPRRAFQTIRRVDRKLRSIDCTKSNG